MVLKCYYGDSGLVKDLVKTLPQLPRLHTLSIIADATRPKDVSLLARGLSMHAKELQSLELSDHLGDNGVRSIARFLGHLPGMRLHLRSKHKLSSLRAT